MQQNTAAILYQTCACWENVAHHFKKIGSRFCLCDKKLRSPYFHPFHIIQCCFLTAQGEYCMGNHYQHWYREVGGNNALFCDYSCRKGSESVYFSKEFGARLWFCCCVWLAGNMVRDIRANEQLRTGFWMDVLDTSLVLKIKGPCGAIWGIKRGKGNYYVANVKWQSRKFAIWFPPLTLVLSFISAVLLDRFFNWAKKAASEQCNIGL